MDSCKLALTLHRFIGILVGLILGISGFTKGSEELRFSENR